MSLTSWIAALSLCLKGSIISSVQTKAGKNPPVTVIKSFICFQLTHDLDASLRDSDQEGFKVLKKKKKEEKWLPGLHASLSKAIVGHGSSSCPCPPISQTHQQVQVLIWPWLIPILSEVLGAGTRAALAPPICLFLAWRSWDPGIQDCELGRIYFWQQKVPCLCPVGVLQVVPFVNSNLLSSLHR